MQKIECIPGTRQERFPLPVRVTTHSSNARRNKAHLTDENNS
jgi:hypothetical protein